MSQGVLKLDTHHQYNYEMHHQDEYAIVRWLNNFSYLILNLSDVHLYPIHNIRLWSSLVEETKLS